MIKKSISFLSISFFIKICLLVSPIGFKGVEEFFSPERAFAVNCTISSNCTWNSSTTICGCAIGAGNNIVIASGVTVTVSGNLSTAVNFTLSVNGTLNFPGAADKIQLGVGSKIDVYSGGTVTGSGASNQIRIGAGSAEWSGSAGPIVGPATIVDGVLPVELINFTAAPEQKKMFIKWSTGSELNNDYYEIERSEDAKVFYSLIKVKGAGTTSSISNYYEYDSNPINGASYYRLKQIDFDGKETIYNSVKVEFKERDKAALLTVYPNPTEAGATTNIHITGFSPETNVLVVLRDINGKEVCAKIVLTDVYGETFIALDVEQHLPSGIYIVAASSEDKIYNHKLIIK